MVMRKQKQQKHLMIPVLPLFETSVKWNHLLGVQELGFDICNSVGLPQATQSVHCNPHRLGLADLHQPHKPRIAFILPSNIKY